MASKKTLTVDQVKAGFRRNGQTVTRWAEENGFRPHAVYQVLGKFTKSTRGQSHEIAVALGLKESPDQHAA